MVTKIIFIGVVIALAVQRLLEVSLSRRHEVRLLAQGGREHAPEHFKWMTALHVSWFVAMIAEVVWLDRPFVPALSIVALLGLIAGQGLRYAAILTLGERWTVRVVTLPGAPAVDRGIYRYVRHPNYLGVVLEIAAVPLLHTAYLTAIVFTLANASVLITRIRIEERALRAHSGYDRVFEDRPRFIPRLSRSKQHD